MPENLAAQNSEDDPGAVGLCLEKTQNIYWASMPTGVTFRFAEGPRLAELSADDLYELGKARERNMPIYARTHELAAEWRAALRNPAAWSLRRWDGQPTDPTPEYIEAVSKIADAIRPDPCPWPENPCPPCKPSEVRELARLLAAALERLKAEGIPELPEVPAILLDFNPTPEDNYGFEDYADEEQGWVIRGSGIRAACDAAYETLQDLWSHANHVAPSQFMRAIVALTEQAQKKTGEEDTGKAKHPRAKRGPAIIPQPTFPEPYAQARAMADGPGLINWEVLEYEDALIHHAPGNKQYTRLAPGPLLDWFGLPATKESLLAEIQQAGLPAAVLMLTTLGWLLTDPKSIVDRPLDDLILATRGRRPANAQERQEWRRQTWRWLLLCESLTTPGPRPGKYKDPDTGEVIDTLSEDSLFHVFGKQMQQSLDNSEPPLTVTIGLTPKIDRLVNRHEILTTYGDLTRICAIPDGKTSGAWARAIGLELQQLFRKRANTARVKHQGEENTPAIPMQFTRREVLAFVRGDVEALLASSDPIRAREYWNSAVELLLPPKRGSDKRAGILAAKPREVDKPPRPWKEWRQDWQKFWYEEQRLEFRPGPKGVTTILEVQEGAKRARKKLASSKPQKRAK